MVFLQEQIVNFLRQYSMPLLEVSLVFSKYTRQLTDALEVQVRLKENPCPQYSQNLGQSLVNKMENPLKVHPLETLLGNLDDDRMDILDTILRSAMNATEMPLVDALMQLRQWEHLARNQLASAKGAGNCSPR